LSSETDDEDLLWWLIAANSEEVLGEGVKMMSRFVVVPAIPTQTASMRNGARFYCKTAPESPLDLCQLGGAVLCRYVGQFDIDVYIGGAWALTEYV
jgi:hypothetical protein